MNFEIQYQVLQKIECITRGGMCMPFHTMDHNANRLSIDIDLLTKSSVSDVEKIMNEISDVLDEIEIELIVPKNPYPIPNLCSYKVHYTSFSGARDWVKVDYLCEMNADLPTSTVPINYQLFAFTTDYEMEILTRGGLIGDKLTTLSLGTIGLSVRNFLDIPKQIFDIGSQIRLISKENILETIETFDKFTNLKIKNYHHSPPFTINDVIHTIESSLLKFIELDHTSVHLIKDQDDKFGNFLGMYLGNYRYGRTEHVGNILLILLLVKKINACFNFPKKKDEIGMDFFNTVNKINMFPKYDLSEKRKETQQLLSGELPEFVELHKKMLRGQPLEYVFLLIEIYRFQDEKSYNL